MPLYIESHKILKLSPKLKCIHIFIDYLLSCCLIVNCFHYAFVAISLFQCVLRLKLYATASDFSYFHYALHAVVYPLMPLGIKFQ